MKEKKMNKAIVRTNHITNNKQMIDSYQVHLKAVTDS